jgi:hypothetical protein
MQFPLAEGTYSKRAEFLSWAPDRHRPHQGLADARAEPAIGFLVLLAPALSCLSGMILTRMADGMTGTSDLQASNLAAMDRSFYLARAELTRIYPMGPRPSVAAMVTMLSYKRAPIVSH